MVILPLCAVALCLFVNLCGAQGQGYVAHSDSGVAFLLRFYHFGQFTTMGDHVQPL